MSSPADIEDVIGKVIRKIVEAGGEDLELCSPSKAFSDFKWPWEADEK